MNFLGVLYDWFYSRKNSLALKGYMLKSNYLSALLFRTFWVLFSSFFHIFNTYSSKRYWRHLIEIILLFVSIYFIFSNFIQINDIKLTVCLSIVFWSFCWSYLSSINDFLWHNFDGNLDDLPEIEQKMLYNTASDSDRLKVFFQSFLLSFMSPSVFLFSLVTLLLAILLKAII
jgi:hypothetical protein